MNNITSQYYFAQAYNEGVYSCGSYQQGSCSVGSGSGTTQPSAPDTGFFSQSPLLVYPILFVVAIVLASVSFTVTKRLKRAHRQ